MILVDTGPLVALFDPKDAQHSRCREVLASLREPLFVTVPVLTETFHMLTPGSHGADRLRDFILQGGLSLWFMDGPSLQRAFELMEQYADHPMDLADASLIVAAEALGTLRIFTIDRRDFATYRVPGATGTMGWRLLLKPVAALRRQPPFATQHPKVH